METAMTAVTIALMMPQCYVAYKDAMWSSAVYNLSMIIHVVVCNYNIIIKFNIYTTVNDPEKNNSD